MLKTDVIGQEGQPLSDRFGHLRHRVGVPGLGPFCPLRTRGEALTHVGSRPCHMRVAGPLDDRHPCLAQHLVGGGRSGRDAHHITGSLVAMAEAQACDLPDLTLEQMKSAHDGITADVFDVLGVENSVNSRTSYGGTAPAQVRAQVARWKEVLS